MSENLSSLEIRRYPNLIDELDSSALTIGSKIFSHCIVMMVVHQTNLYENRDKIEEKFEIDEQELKRFLVILLISGYHILPHVNHC